MKMEIVGVKKPIIIHKFFTAPIKHCKEYGYKSRGMTLILEEFDGEYLTIYLSQCSIKDSFCRKTGVTTAYNNPPHVIPLINLSYFIEEIGRKAAIVPNSRFILNKILFGKWRVF